MSPPPRAAPATLCREPFFEDGWVFERKLDGMRVLAERRGSSTTLWSQSGRDTTESFPEVARALTAQTAGDLVVDGEVVAFEGNRTSFARLRPRIQARGEDVRDRPWRERNRLLRHAVRFEDPIRLTRIERST